MASNDSVRPLTAMDSPVAEVTLLEDRAHVIRRGTVKVNAGRCHLVVEDVSPVLCDKSLAARVVGDGGAKVVNARIVRRDVIRPLASTDAAAAPLTDTEQLEVELDALDDKIAAERARFELLQKQTNSLDRIASLSYAELAEDVTWGTAIGDEWSERLDQLSRRERELVAELVVLENGIAELERTRGQLYARISAQQTREHTELAVIEIELAADAAGEFAVQVDYLVPGACWRPYHTARLDESGEAQLVFETDACVWQNTGEDWTDCALVFSTERPSLGTEPPQFNTDLLRVTRKSDSVVVAAREQEITTTGLGADETIASPELPGIDDGGEPLILRALDRASVPSDGRPYRVRLSAFESDAGVELVAYPELSPCVLTKTIQSNRGQGPILAGPVDLIRASGFVGRTSLLFVAAGEKFELGWGPVAELRIARSEETQAEKSRMLSSWVNRRHKIEVRISNLADQSYSVTVKERMPVSEIDKVKIESDSDVTTAQKSPDAHGFVTWDVQLEPFGHESLDLGYIFKRHEDVAEV